MTIRCGQVLGPDGPIEYGPASLALPDPQSTGRVVLRWALGVLRIVALCVLAIVASRLIRLEIAGWVHRLTGHDLVAGSYHLGPLIDFLGGYMLARCVIFLFGGGIPYAARWGLLGCWATITLLHNLAWWFPETMRGIYSEAWVNEIEQISEPDSIFLGVVSIPFESIQIGADEGRRVPSNFVSATDDSRTTPGFTRQIEVRRAR